MSQGRNLKAKSGDEVQKAFQDTLKKIPEKFVNSPEQSIL